jgi:hypothetical protein
MTNVSYAVKDLKFRLSTTLSKELSNSKSRASWFALSVSWASKVVEPGLTGPKGEETFDLTVVVTECL